MIHEIMFWPVVKELSFKRYCYFDLWYSFCSRELTGLILVEGIMKKISGEMKLEDLKVLRRSPDLLNNVKKGQGQL